MKEEGRSDKPEDLRERTLEFGLRIVKMFGQLPKTDEARTIGRQVLRSGTSIGSNYREARRSRSKPEFIAIDGICLTDLDNLPEPEILADEIIDNIEAGLASFRAVAATLSRAETT